MRQFFASFFGAALGVFAVGALMVFSLIALIASFAQQAGVDSKQATASKTMPTSVVLHLDLRQPIPDQPHDMSFSFSKQISMVQLVQALERAEKDKHIKGIFLRASSFSGLSGAQAQELRDSLKKFQKAGKFIIAHAQGFESTSISNYWGVSVADEIWLQDTTNFSPSGLGAEVDFLGGFFEKFKVKPEFEQFYEYKNAANSYTEKGFTEAHKEAMDSLLHSIWETAVTDIAEDRNIESTKLTSLFQASPYSAQNALKAGFIDKIGYVKQARDHALSLAEGEDGADEADTKDQDNDSKKTKDSIVFMDVHDYYAKSGTPYDDGPVIALIGGQGPIVTGEGQSENPFNNQPMIGSDTMAQAIYDAIEDKNVRAIILRVDSPGGSATASDQIWYAVKQAQKAGKPVVVSMSRLAASGGYYIAAGADKIIALPSTITGSIGVLGGKLVFKGPANLLGINIEQISVGGPYTLAYSRFESFTPEQRSAFRALLEDTYKDFTTRVAEGRKLPLEEVLKIAKGRVWTGEQAKEIGLVDELGGLHTALEAAKELASIKPEEKVSLKPFPRPLTPFEQFQKFFGLSSETAQSLATVQAVLQTPEVQSALKAHRLASMPEKTLLLEPNSPEIK